MISAVFEIGFKKEHQLFKAFVVMHQRLIDQNVGNANAVHNGGGIMLGNRIEQGGKAVAISALALADAKGDHIAAMAAVRGGGGLIADNGTVLPMDGVVCICPDWKTK